MDNNVIFIILDFLIHLDRHLTDIISTYGLWSYCIIFLIIFCETGLVVTPFLPGDSFIFVLGALASNGEINGISITIILCAAAITGNIVNYHIGRYIGPLAFESGRIPFLKEEYLVRTQQFYEQHGGKTIVIARFLAVIRTFAPFVAGIGKMNYGAFMFYNVLGCLAWVFTFMLGGYFFGNLPIVEKYFSLAILLIFIVPGLPALIALIRSKYPTKSKKKNDTN